MHGFKGIISKSFSRIAQEALLLTTAVLISCFFIYSWPQGFVFLRQYLPKEMSLKWFVSFSSLDNVTNIQLAEYYNSLAGVYIKEGKFDQAIAAYNKAIEIKITAADPYYNRGCLYVKLGDFDLAIKDFIKVIQMNPKFVQAYDNLGFVYAKQGQLKQAVSFFTKALEIDPHYAPAYYNRDVVYHRLKEHDNRLNKN